MQGDPTDAEAIANFIVLNVISGKGVEEMKERLEGVEREHPFLVDLREKGEAFDQAAGRYAAKAAS